MSEKSDSLGALISTHETGLLRYWPLHLIAICLFAMGAILGGAGVKNGNASDTVIASIIFLILGMIPAFIGWYYSINKAQLYEDGFIYTTRRLVTTMRWNEISIVYEFVARVNVNGVPTAPQYRYSVRSEANTVVRFSPRLENIQDLGNVLLRLAERRKLPIVEGMAYRFGAPKPERTKMLDVEKIRS